MLSAVSVKTPDPAAMKQARPTLRALTVDMHLPVPEVDIPLDALEHPLLAKASEQFVDGGGRHERIRRSSVGAARSGLMGPAVDDGSGSV